MTAISDPAAIISQGMVWRVACNMKFSCCSMRLGDGANLLQIPLIGMNISFCQPSPLATFLDPHYSWD